MILVIKTRDDIKQDVRYRFYPRKLIVDTDQNVFNYTINNCLLILNKYTYYVRYISYKFNNANEKIIDLTTLSYGDGIKTCNVVEVLPSKDVENIFTAYTQILGRAPFYYMISTQSQLFTEFLYANKLIDDLERRYRNTTKILQIGDKLYLDNLSFNIYNEVVIKYLPVFDINSDKWLFFQDEYLFFVDLLEAVIMYREGRAQSELSFAGDLAGNYEIYLKMVR